MTDSDLATLDATAQAELVRNGEATPLELVDAAINRIEKVNAEINAVIHPLFDHAREAASGDLPDGPFRGVPTLLKDLDGEMAGFPNHFGNKLLKEIDYRPDVDTSLYTRLRDAGFVVAGKTNTPEFGLLPTTEPLAYGPTRNPWNTGHGAGGSSGGSAAAVAAGMVPVAHAGDGGGSIRIPASACGLFGLKPSRARVPMGPGPTEGWAGFTTRHVVTRSVRDSAAILDVLEGPTTGDYYTAPPPARPYAKEVGADPGRLRIGLRLTAPANLAEVDPECANAAEDAARALEALGHTVEEAAPAAFEDDTFLQRFTTIFASNAAADAADVGTRAGREVTEADFEPGTWVLVELGRAMTAPDYIEAQMALQTATRDLVAWWDGDDAYDLLLTPTMAALPPELGFVNDPDDPLGSVARATPFAAFTAVFNVTGQPAVSIPWSTSGSGLPIGIQLVAAPWREDVLLRISAQIEAAHPWADRRPGIHA